MTLATNKQKTQAITHLIWVEQNWWCYSSFHQHMKPKSSGLDPLQPLQIIMEPEEMNKTLLEYSRNHFVKAQARLSLYSCTSGPPPPIWWPYPFGSLVLHGHAELDSLPMEPLTCALLKHLCNKATNPNARNHPLNYAELHRQHYKKGVF